MLRCRIKGHGNKQEIQATKKTIEGERATLIVAPHNTRLLMDVNYNFHILIIFKQLYFCFSSMI